MPSAPLTPPRNARVGLLFVYGLAAFTTVLNITMMSPLLVPIAAEFSRSEASAGQLSTITAGFAFGTALLIAPILDRYPRRLWLRAQAALVALAAGLTAMAGSFALVLFGRALAGIGGAIIIALCYASAADNFPIAQQRHRVVGMIASFATLGSILGLPIMAVVAEALSWRWAVLLIVPFALLVFAGSGQVRESPVAGHTASVRYWTRNYRHVLSQRGVASMLGVMIAILVARFGWFVYLGAYSERGLGASAAALGGAFAAGGVAHMVGSNVAPLLLTRFSPRRIAAATSGVMALDLASVGLYGDAVWTLFPFIMVFSACWAICFVSSSIYLLDMNPDARSTVSALQSAAMEFGIGAGAALGGLLLAAFDDYEPSFRSLALLFPLVFLLLVLSSREPAGEDTEPASVLAPAPGPLTH
jgi:MFS transporter, DHA1 family, inner membrane transport protein